MVRCQYNTYSPQGGEKLIRTGVKLACKTVFINFSESGGRPKLLVRRRRARRQARKEKVWRTDVKPA